jgi:hypothetical protein
MKRLFCAVLIWLLSIPCAALAAVSPGTRVVLAPGQEVPTYQSLEMAQKNDSSEPRQGPAEISAAGDGNSDYLVAEQKDGWLLLKETPESEESFWVKTDKVMPTDAFLLDPAYKDITMLCRDDLPMRFDVALDADHKNAVIRMIAKPGLNGGTGEMEVLAGDGKTPLWSTTAQDDDAGLRVRFSCNPNVPTWPTIVGDVNGDGKAEILYTETDPRAPYDMYPFPVLNIVTWDGKAFALAGSVMLAVNAETMPGSGPLVEQGFPDGQEEAESRFSLAELVALKDNGSFTAKITHEAKDKEPKQGVAILQLSVDNTQFLFKGWETEPE